MTYLVHLTEKDIFPDNPPNKTGELVKRNTVKAVVVDDSKKIALITNKTHNYYLLPGGGVEESEEFEDAIRRECVEEIGYEVEIVRKIAVTKEYRTRDHKEYDSHCYLARAIKKHHDDYRTENERKHGLEVKWFSEDEVIKIFTSQQKELGDGKIKFYNTGFNIVRDKIFFEEARKHIQTHAI